MSLNYGNFSAKTVQENNVSVVSNSWTALPTTALSGRQYVEVYNKSPYKIYFSFDSTAPVKYRAAIAGGELRGFPIQDNLTLYARSQGGGARVIVTEYR